MSTRFPLVTLGVCSAALTMVLACASSPSAPPASPEATQDGGALILAVMAPDASAPVPVVPGPGPSVPPSSVDAGASPMAMGEAAVVDAVVDLAINAAAPKLAPKMEREGQPVRATLKEGEHFPVMVTLAPNRCYSIVATSPIGSVEKLELKLFGPPFYNVEAGKSGASDKNMPVIGKGSAALCPVLPLPVPYKLDVFASKGAGRVGVHILSRSK